MSVTQDPGWSSRRVLVTGAGGFIGSHLTEELVRLGARVRAFVRYTSGGKPGLLADLPREVQRELEIVPGDLRDALAVREACRGITHIFHLGALVAIPYSYLHPVEVVETNCIGTLNVLLAARDLGVERIVHTSTSEVYGTAQTPRIAETHPLRGQSPYSASKIGADKIAESFYCAYDLPVVTVRPFNTYGPRQSARAVIPTIITQALACDYIVLGNLSPRRDLTYVADTVSGFLCAGQADGVLGETFNLGVGTDISIGELAQLIIRLVGRPVQVQGKRERFRPDKSEVMRLRSDNRRARRLLAWEPTVSLESGLQQTIEWVSHHLDRYRVGEYEV